MAHEIRTPLSLISAPVEELLANPSIGQSTRSRLEVVERSVKSLKSVVDQVLDLRKYEDNMMGLQVVKVNVCKFLAEAAELFVPLAKSRGIMFRVDMPEEPLEAYIDKYKMERVVVNLLSNAFKFTPEGGTVCLSCSGDDAHVTFSVQDNGQGISEKDQAHIFERFYQGHNRTEDNGTGTSIEVLLARVRTLIANRDKARLSFGGIIEAKPSDVEVESPDERLVKKCLELVEENMDDSDFGVDELCGAVGMSRPQLYRRLRAATGDSPVVFIRSVRLKRAAQILSGDSSSVSSVMFQVGFNSLSYFSKLFREQYGCLPKEYARIHGKGRGKANGGECGGKNAE